MFSKKIIYILLFLSGCSKDSPKCNPAIDQEKDICNLPEGTKLVTVSKTNFLNSGCDLRLKVEDVTYNLIQEEEKFSIKFGEQVVYFYSNCAKVRLTCQINVLFNNQEQFIEAKQEKKQIQLIGCKE
jgi:hypothetical protein